VKEPIVPTQFTNYASLLLQGTKVRNFSTFFNSFLQIKSNLQHIEREIFLISKLVRYKRKLSASFWFIRTGLVLSGSMGEKADKVIKYLKGISVCSWIKISLVLAIVLIVASVFILALLPGTNLSNYLLAVMNWIDALPSWLAAICMLEIFAFFIPFGCPMTPLNLVAGFLFGAFWGTVVAISGALVGSTICYVWALTLVQEWAEKQLESKKIFKAIEMAVQNEAMKFIILTHLCPLFSTTILNYLFATMGVNFIKFFLGTGIGFVPLTFMYCYIGSVSASLVSAFQGDEAGIWKIVVILLFAVVSLVLLILVLGWIGKREYNRILKEYEEKESTENLELLKISDSEESFSV
jgi:uncharacterized membrane protein YdjX (TVP38/TMEM64 family)